MILTHKYLPKTEEEVKGQETALRELKAFFSSFKPGKAAIVWGPVGCGKTSLVHALAASLNKEVFEINASDVRNKAQIEDIVKAASQQQSLSGFGKEKIILFDEADGLSGRKDRGGAAALAPIIKESVFPIVLTATDPYHKKLKPVRKASILIECSPLNHEVILERLEEICKKEKIKYEVDVLKEIARRVGGDMRAALTDLEVLAASGDINTLGLFNERDHTETIEAALIKVFKTSKAEIAKDAFFNVSEDINQQMLWIDENLPRAYSSNDLAEAYDNLSKADVFLGRIRRWQHWRFLVYASALLSAGVALSNKEPSVATTYKQPTRILQLWMAKMKYHKREEIARKVAEQCHTSTKRAVQDIIPYVQVMVKNNASLPEFDLSEEEVAWLRK
jgi:replication factor C large subunit